MPLLAPRSLLHTEGGVALVLAVLLYWRDGSSWWLFAGLLLAPDIGMLGYLAGTRVGAITYNFLHTYALALPLAAYGYLAESGAARAIGLIWLAHIAVDRLLGYGLKYPGAFQDTHLGHV